MGMVFQHFNLFPHLTVLQNITTEIENTYMKLFTEEDSIIIFKLSETCKKTCYGYAKNEDKDFFLI